jgi:hypothetical protein
LRSLLKLLTCWKHRRAIRAGRKRYEAKHRYDALIAAAEVGLHAIECNLAIVEAIGVQWNADLMKLRARLGLS